MIDVAAIAALAAQGFTVLVFPDGSMEVKAAPDTRSAAAKRQAAYRQNKASESVTKHNEPSQTVTSDANVTLPLPLAPSLPLPTQTPPSPAHPHTPTPADTHAPVRENGSQKPKRSTPKPADDDDWLKSLEADPTYAGVAIRVELGKMRRWCEENHQIPSRKRFVNWINRAPRPMNGHHHNGKPRNQAYQGGASATAGKTADQIGNLFGEQHDEP